MCISAGSQQSAVWYTRSWNLCRWVSDGFIFFFLWTCANCNYGKVLISCLSLIAWKQETCTIARNRPCAISSTLLLTKILIRYKIVVFPIRHVKFLLQIMWPSKTHVIFNLTSQIHRWLIDASFSSYHDKETVALPIGRIRTRLKFGYFSKFSGSLLTFFQVNLLLFWSH